MVGERDKWSKGMVSGQGDYVIGLEGLRTAGNVGWIDGWMLNGGVWSRPVSDALKLLYFLLGWNDVKIKVETWFH